MKFVPFNNFRIRVFGAVGPVVLNSPTWKVSLPTVYWKATANTSSLFKAWLSEIYPNWLLKEYYDSDSFLALSNFSKSVPFDNEVDCNVLFTSLIFLTPGNTVVREVNISFAKILSG